LYHVSTDKSRGNTNKKQKSPFSARSTEKGDIRYCNRETRYRPMINSHGLSSVRFRCKQSVYRAASDCQADSVRSFYLTGTKATGANIHRLGRTADNSLYSSDVRLEHSVFLTVRVRYRVTECDTLSAYTALCHVTDTSCELRLS